MCIWMSFFAIITGRMKEGRVLLDWNEIDRFTKSLIKEAGHKIRRSFSEPIHIDIKSNVNDLVTNIDRKIEQFFIQHIQFAYPDHQVLGEEGFGDEITSLDGVTWIIDPIDGTTNFVHQQQNFAISIGVYNNGVGMLGYIYDVINDDLYAGIKDQGAYLNDERLPKLGKSQMDHAIIGINARWLLSNRHVNHEKIQQLVKDCRGTRSYGSATMEMAYVMTGKLDAYISMQLSPWDIAGGMVIAKEVGVTTSNLAGEQLGILESTSFIMARQGLHDKLLSNYIELK